MPETLTYRCPFCDHEVQIGQPCPGCRPHKAKPPRQRKPWHQDQAADGLDLPDDDFDYDAFVAREFGGAPHRRLGLKWYWWLLGVIVLATMAAVWMFRWP